MKTISYLDYASFSKKKRKSFTGTIKWYDGVIEYRENGKLHRLDGPAVTWNDGREFYFIQDVKYSKEDWESLSTFIKYRLQNEST